jgi:long-subunit acyl-CoA synthetase (AMP-forming)
MDDIIFLGIIIFVIIIIIVGIIYKKISHLKNTQENMKLINLNITSNKYDDMTILDILKFVSENYSKNNAFMIKQNGKWNSITYLKYYKMVKNFAQSLNYLIGNNVNVSIFGFNSTGWIYAYLGTMLNGGIVVNIDYSYNKKQLKKILVDTNVEVIVIENEKMLKQILSLDNINIKYIIYYSHINCKNVGKIPKNIILLNISEFMKNKKKLEKTIMLNDISTIIYKNNVNGIMLSHNNLISTVRKYLEILKLKSSIKIIQENIVSYLPLTNLITQYYDIFIPICTLSTVWFADKNVLNDKKPSLLKLFKEIKPTILLGNIETWNILKDNIEKQINTISGSITKTILPWNLLNYLNLKQCKYYINLNNDTTNDLIDYFKLNNIFLYQIFGNIETSGIISFTAPKIYKNKSVGLPICDVKMTENNELYINGSNVFVGYYNNEFDTLDALTNDKYYISPYIAQQDIHGYLYILN